MIDGNGYGLATDVWSLGTVEMVLCEGSVPHDREANPREGITLISELPAPRLTTPGSASTVALGSVAHQGPPRLQPWTPELLDFVDKSLEKDPLKRASLTSLMAHPWVSEAVGSLSTSFSPSSAVALYH
jgi:serine/threonine protein kinase